MSAFNKIVDVTITGAMFVMTGLAYVQGLVFALLVIALVTALV